MNWKKILWFLLTKGRNLGKLPQAILIEFALILLWKVAKDYLKVHQNLDVDAVKQRIQGEILTSLKKENLGKTFKAATNKGVLLKNIILGAVKKVVPLKEKESKELDLELQKKANSIDELLNENGEKE